MVSSRCALAWKTATTTNKRANKRDLVLDIVLCSLVKGQVYREWTDGGRKKLQGGWKKMALAVEEVQCKRYSTVQNAFLFFC